MKNKELIILSGNLGTILVILSGLFKIQHYPFQNELMTIGLVLFAVFWIWILVELFKQSRSLTYKAIWTLLVVIMPVIGSWLYYHTELKRKRTTG